MDCELLQLCLKDFQNPDPAWLPALLQGSFLPTRPGGPLPRPVLASENTIHFLGRKKGGRVSCLEFKRKLDPSVFLSMELSLSTSSICSL